MFIETITGSTSKKATKLVWEKRNVKLRNFANMQIIFLTNNPEISQFHLQIIGRNKERTQEFDFVNQDIIAKEETLLFNIKSKLLANNDSYSYDILITSEFELFFSIVAIYTTPRYSADGDPLEELEGAFETDPNDEDLVEIKNFKFDGRTVTRCTQNGGVIQIPSSYKLVKGKFYEGDDIAVDTIGSCILSGARNYTEVIIPDSIINFPIYGLGSELARSCKKIVIGDGFGLGKLDTYPFGNTLYCETIEIGKNLKLINGYIFGAFNNATHTIKFAGENPPELSGTNWIGTLSSLNKILVPMSGLEKWRTALYWSNFAHIIEGYEPGETNADN